MDYSKASYKELLIGNSVYSSLINVSNENTFSHLWQSIKYPVYDKANPEVQISWGFTFSCIYCNISFDDDDLDNTHPLHQASLRCLWVGRCDKRTQANKEQTI